MRRCFDDGALARTTLLAVLRDPAARLYSEYAVIRSRQPDRFGNATFARAVDGWLSDRGDAEGRRLLAVGHYVDQLLAWHQHLPREALYVVPAAALDDDATHVRDSARNNRWNGPVRRNLKPLGQIEVVSADFWTHWLLSSRSQSTAESLASKRSHTRTLKSG